MIFRILRDSMDSCIEHEEQERSLFPQRIVESEEQVRPSLRLVRGRFIHAKDRVIIGCVYILNIYAKDIHIILSLFLVIAMYCQASSSQFFQSLNLYSC